jgi:hypothetical protein
MPLNVEADSGNAKPTDRVEGLVERSLEGREVARYWEKLAGTHHVLAFDCQ